MENYFELLRARTAGKKLILYGVEQMGSHVITAAEMAGVPVSYCIDKSREKQEKLFFGLEVKSPYELLYEDRDSVFIVIASHTHEEQMRSVLESMGFEYRTHFMFGDESQYEKTDRLDFLLGPSREDDTGGFKIFGDGRKKIVALGGSTTDWSLFQIHSWPYCLWERMKARGEEPTVYAGGIAGYHAVQEMLKLIKDALPLKPNLVLLFSGYNDSAKNHGFWDVSFPMANPHIGELYRRLKEAGEKDGMRVPELTYGVENPVSDGEFWYTCVRIMHAVCQEFGIEFHAFLQPDLRIAGGGYIYSEREKRYLSQLPEAFARQDYQFHREVEALIEGKRYIHNFRDIFGGKSGLFYDIVHCTEEGNQIIAEKIDEVVYGKLL